MVETFGPPPSASPLARAPCAAAGAIAVLRIACQRLVMTASPTFCTGGRAVLSAGGRGTPAEGFNRASRRHECKLLLRIAPIPGRHPRRVALVMTAAGRARSPEVSQRIRSTDDPVMVQAMRLIGGVTNVVSLAQGAVYWGPPKTAIQKGMEQAYEPSTSSYGPDEGQPALRATLQKKIEEENGLHGYKVIVTAGANQALTHLMLVLVDPHDTCVLFRPYYFNMLMAVQMTGGGATVVHGPSSADSWKPDLDWLEAQLAGPRPPKLVYVVNPCNPTGVTLAPEEVERLAAMTGAAGTWLVMDQTYEYFRFSGVPRCTPAAPHIVYVYSLSKGHGMMGWRVGYVAYPDLDGSNYLGLQLVKVQDTNPIHSAHLSQAVALAALEEGDHWRTQNIETLRRHREILLKALRPLGTLGDGIYGGDAIYMWCRLPEGCQDDKAVIQWMVGVHGVSVIPGSGCGCPGYIRVAFGKPAQPAFEEATSRLHAALIELAAKGMSVVKAWQERREK